MLERSRERGAEGSQSLGRSKMGCSRAGSKKTQDHFCCRKEKAWAESRSRECEVTSGSIACQWALQLPPRATALTLVLAKTIFIFLFHFTLLRSKVSEIPIQQGHVLYPSPFFYLISRLQILWGALLDVCTTPNTAGSAVEHESETKSVKS